MNEYRSEYLRRQIMQQQATKTAAAKRAKARNSRRANVLLIGTALMALLLLAIIPMRFRAIADDKSEPELKYLSANANAGVIEAPTLMDARLSTTTQDAVSELAQSIMTTDNADLSLAEESLGVSVTTVSPSDVEQQHIASWDDYDASNLASQKDANTQQDMLPLYKPNATTSLYYVALLDTSHVTGDAALIDVQVLKNGSPVQAGDGVIYDGDTGILYVPQELSHDGMLFVNALRFADSSQDAVAPSEEPMAEEAILEIEEGDYWGEAPAELAEEADTSIAMSDIQPGIPMAPDNPLIMTVLDTGRYQLAAQGEQGPKNVELLNIFDYGMCMTHPAYPGVTFCSFRDFRQRGFTQLTAHTSTEGESVAYDTINLRVPLRAALDSGFELVAIRNGLFYEVKTVADAYATGFMLLYYEEGQYAPSFSKYCGGLTTQSVSDDEEVTAQNAPPVTLSSLGGFRLTWSVPSNPLFDNPVPVQTKAPALVAESTSFRNYYSTNASVASVDSGGMVTTRAVGKAQIWAESQYGNVNDNERADMQAGEQTLLVTVTVTNATERKSSSITVPNTSMQVGVSKTGSIGATTISDAPIKYASSDTDVATVSASGVVTGKKLGNATITIKTAQTDAYKAARAMVSVQVVRRATSIKVPSTNMQIVAGKTGSIGATTTSDAPIMYASSDKNVATVSASGVVTGKKPGNATITIMTAQTHAALEAWATVSVQVVRRAASITVSNASMRIVAGKTSSIGATKTSNAPIKYASSDTNVATVSASGVVTGKKPGDATITITTAQTDAYKAAQKFVEVAVLGDVAGAKVSAPSVTYDGKAHNGAITVTLSGKTLKPSTDYMLDITNSAGTPVTAIKNAGKYTVVVRGKGNYTGTTKKKPVVMTVAKAANTAKVTATKTKVAVKHASVKKKAQTVSNLTGKSIKGTVKCTNVSTNTTAQKFKVSTKGVVTVPKGTKKGTYTVKIKVTAAGNANYKPYKKTVVYKIVVK